MTTRFTPLSSIVISPTRQRRTHDPLAHEELISSIKARGLLNAINLRQEGDSLVLVAGERRLRAMAELYELGEVFSYGAHICSDGQIPYLLLSDLDELAAEEAELDENIRRSDLSWQDRAMATTRLLTLRQKQAAKENLPPPTHVDIAEELHGRRTGGLVREVRKDVILSRNMGNPAVSGAKNPHEALKALHRCAQTKKAKESAQKFKTSGGQNHKYQLWQQDCLSWMRESPAGVFDCVVTDPPYGIQADKFGTSDDYEGVNHAGGKHFYEDSAELVTTIINFLPAELFRLTKPEAHCYIFCDFSRFADWSEGMVKAGWKVFRTPLIWFKPSAYRAPWPQQGPQRKYETILYAVKGEKKCLRLGGDVITQSPDKNLGHHAQKPVALYVDLLTRSCFPGEKIFDPFAGSGPIFDAAKELSLYAVGCEVDPEAAGIAVHRIEALLKEDHDLFK